MKAIWNGAVIAESDDVVVVENNCYFPLRSLRREFTQRSEHTSECAWKGTAHYYAIRVNGVMNADAAWYYPDPKPGAEIVRDRVAFWKGVAIVD